MEILTLLAGGASNETIARSLSISARTAERHIANIYLKIGAHNRAEATAYAFRQRIASLVNAICVFPASRLDMTPVFWGPTKLHS